MSNKARTCPRCHGVIPAFTTAYTLRLQLFAEAGTVHITPDDLAEDHERRIRELYKEAEGTDPQDLMDEVYESYTLTICAGCRKELHGDLSRFLKERKDEV
jgi:hypothetical protein